MKAALVLLAIAGALAFETTLAQLVPLSRGVLDLVLVVVVFVALVWGPVPGLLAGALGGLVQDSLSATGVMAVSAGGAISLAEGIVGAGGLAKTIVGFGIGQLGTLVIVAGLVPRLAVFFAASVIHAVVFLGLSMVFNERLMTVPYGAVLAQGLGNAVIGGLAFEFVRAYPGMVERWRARRHRLGRRL